jgi:hypothetical protein
MTRKRYVKLLMFEGFSRNQANVMADYVRRGGVPYDLAWIIGMPCTDHLPKN